MSSSAITKCIRLSVCLMTCIFVLNIVTSTEASSIFRPAKCLVCTDADRAKCPALEAGPDCEVILEPNCGCCKMCAKKVGENCGVATGLCETGLECIPPPMTSEQYKEYEQANYFMEALMGEFICVTREQFINIISGVAYEEDGEVSNSDDLYTPDLYHPFSNYDNEEENYLNTEGMGEEKTSETEIPVLQDLGHLNPFNQEAQIETASADRPSEPPTSPHQNSLEPCIYHADKVWGKEHFDHHEWIPSCDTDGYYFPEQCELSFGLERGRCWCVDRLGTPVSKFIPGDEASPDKCMPTLKKT